MNPVEQMLKFLGELGVIVGIAFLFFRFLGKRWIENKFQKSLEDHKHKHDEEIQRLKCEIDLQLSRVTKIHEKEFEVLPIAWEKLDSLLDLVRQFIRETHSIPDLNNKSSQELEKFLSEQGLKENEKQNVRNKKNKNLWYFHERSEKVGNACLDFQDYITKNAIFLSSDLKSEFKKAEETIRTAWAIRKTAEESKDRNKGITEACKIIQEEITTIMEQIEELVQKRLLFLEA